MSDAFKDYDLTLGTLAANSLGSHLFNDFILGFTLLVILMRLALQAVDLTIGVISPLYYGVP